MIGRKKSLIKTNDGVGDSGGHGFGRVGLTRDARIGGRGSALRCCIVLNVCKRTSSISLEDTPSAFDFTIIAASIANGSLSRFRRTHSRKRRLIVLRAVAFLETVLATTNPKRDNSPTARLHRRVYNGAEKYIPRAKRVLKSFLCDRRMFRASID